MAAGDRGVGSREAAHPLNLSRAGRSAWCCSPTRKTASAGRACDRDTTSGRARTPRRCSSRTRVFRPTGSATGSARARCARQRDRQSPPPHRRDEHFRRGRGARHQSQRAGGQRPQHVSRGGRHEVLPHPPPRPTRSTRSSRSRSAQGAAAVAVMAYVGGHARAARRAIAPRRQAGGSREHARMPHEDTQTRRPSRTRRAPGRRPPRFARLTSGLDDAQLATPTVPGNGHWRSWCAASVVWTEFSGAHDLMLAEENPPIHR